ncbi:hypothetical protein [Vreelandella venusta]|uniref:hypothetical protein n=1 Tax=Vreelandella venusta TaxID=44935 RepID=UPI0018DA5BD6|nr:hypothetical protein [Halomonas venusta]QPI62417.1 hypothetical protein IR195_10955 [Halomonas venusta]
MLIFVPYIASSTNVALRANKHANNREVKAAAWACKAACQGVEPITGKVDLVFRPRLGKGERVRDTSNYSISMKHIEDGLVAAGLLPDDRGQYVRRVIMDPPEIDRKAESGTWVELIPVEVTA